MPEKRWHKDDFKKLLCRKLSENYLRKARHADYSKRNKEKSEFNHYRRNLRFSL